MPAVLSFLEILYLCGFSHLAFSIHLASHVYCTREQWPSELFRQFPDLFPCLFHEPILSHGLFYRWLLCQILLIYHVFYFFVYHCVSPFLSH